MCVRLRHICVTAGLLAALATMAVLGGARPVQARPIALGVNTADATANGGRELDAFKARVGRSPASVMWYQTWSEPLFYSSQMAEVDKRGSVPIITWEPVEASGGVPLRQIASGARDDYLREAARAARAWGKPFFVRFAHEMNGGWYSWGRRGRNRPADYVRAWRHVVHLFRQEGATNVRWVWSPNVTGYGVARFERFYPGDRWVDWVGLDGYNWGSHKSSGWRSFRDVFYRSYRRLVDTTAKPVMIAETGSPEQGGNKAAWIRSGLRRDIPRLMPRVRAMVWFDREKEADWRVNSSTASLGAFRGAVLSRRFALSGKQLSAIHSLPSHPTFALRAVRHGRSVQIRVRVRGAGWKQWRPTLLVTQGRGKALRVRPAHGSWIGALPRVGCNHLTVRVVIRGATRSVLLTTGTHRVRIQQGRGASRR